MEIAEYEARMPLIRKRLPNMHLNTTHGEINIPDEYRYKWVVLLCHPGNVKFPCLTEFIPFAKRIQEFKNLNAELFGLTLEQKCPDIKCISWLRHNLKMKIPFPVSIGDTDNVSQIKEIIIPCRGAIKVRGIFIIDPEGILCLMMYYLKKLNGEVDGVLDTLKYLQARRTIRRQHQKLVQ